MPDDVGNSLNFTGNAALTVDALIQGVRRWAAAAVLDGKILDGNSPAVAIFAVSCLMEDALEWAEGLDENITRSWPLLRKALRDRWKPRGIVNAEHPPQLPIGAGPSNVVRETAPSPGPLPAATAGPSSHQNERNIETGLIRVSDDPDNDMGYICQQLDEDGEIRVTATRDNALRVLHDRLVPSSLKIHDPAEWFGITVVKGS